MNKSQASYMEARLVDRAMAARRESNHLYCMPITFKGMVKELHNGEKYITPASMSMLLDCDMFELMNAVSLHKVAIGDFIFDGNYGNCNYEVHANDKVRLQGWINFLSLPCYSDSLEASEAIRLISEAM